MRKHLRTEIILIAHNLRSCHNVGSLMRTAEGLGINKLYLTGYTPYPSSDNDNRLPHLSQKIAQQIAKTSLGAEKYLSWQQSDDIKEIIDELRGNGFRIIALEQTANSINIGELSTPEKVALIVGREVEGIEMEVLDLCDEIVEIPMLGKKKSFNVVQATAMTLYFLRYISS